MDIDYIYFLFFIIITTIIVIVIPHTHSEVGGVSRI